MNFCGSCFVRLVISVLFTTSGLNDAMGQSPWRVSEKIFVLMRFFSSSVHLNG